MRVFPTSLAASAAFLVSLLGLARPTPAAPQADAGSVLIVMADDLGIEALPLHGLDPAVRPDLTPNLSQLASLGVSFENAWAAPKCSPARAALHTGQAAFRTGIGNVIEAGSHSLSSSRLTLPEMLATHAPGSFATGFFGKWHLEQKSSSQACVPSGLHGYQHFAGSLFQVPPAPGYCDWLERTCESGTGANVRTLQYMPARVFDDAAQWIASRSGRWLCTLAPQQPYDILHTPPANLQSVRAGAPCSSCPRGTRACFDAAIQAFDTKLGELLDSLGPDWPSRVTVIVTADNGTPNEVNTYWPAGRAKLTLYQGGIRVPFIVAGRGVAPERRGAFASDLVSVSDVYRTVAGLAGVTSLPATVAQDSYDLRPALAHPPAPTGRAYALAEMFGRNAPAPPYSFHKVALRNARYKLIYDWSGKRPMGLYDVIADPREQQDLLRPRTPAPNTPAGMALNELVDRIADLMGS